MKKPVLAIITESLRYDNQAALRFFNKIQPVHFYEKAPYGDLKDEDLKNAVQYTGLKDLEQKIIALNPDIIQGAEPYGSRKQLRLCYVAWRISRKLKIPLIFPILENRPVEARFGKTIGLVMKRILKIYSRQASQIFYLNEGAKRNLLEVQADPQKLIKLLYGIWGIDTNIFKPLEAVKKQPIILVMGRLDEAKGLPYVVEAWKEIEKDYPEVSIHFSGKGELDYLIDRCRMSKGFYKNSDMPELINSALFAITASVTLKRWEEQVGMTNLQALACGVPVITTQSGAIPEYVNDKVGILVPEKDAKSLALAMRKLLDDSVLRESLGQNARKYIVENFDAEKTVEKTEIILLKLLKLT